MTGVKYTVLYAEWTIDDRKYKSLDIFLEIYPRLDVVGALNHYVKKQVMKNVL